ncbi:ABC transporter ATP-binding protein [Agrobacterium rhizogenes]|uniref:ABC transporter ATP-binding protein n=1 Tax=Rhizobium rhizogenes TaxID=359 RepID=UPI0004D53C31|nr:ABC transporter ATP-binding protein [Rhizobium rhizogenes]KAA6475694.1 ABC transporter ATP-binding protein [Agrobacterium sp. ICMP 7243]OCJ04679.1 glycine/betaine ABC transporter [Agrobacterium sp. 13-626]OCJ30136.1 glycine/betaine ABC transporter [Agrobacterium sp. B133/95]KEA07830.1 glycine/betaine ABC transporter [Rhizobium rhizogenes]MQB34853.1 ABC transporter ATP-binding protein [Rhizobium rhizogenes]
MIRLDHVTKNYEGSERHAVDTLELEIETGTTVALIGPSGCGKTTTMRMINRLETPTRGRVLVNGRDVAETDQKQLRRSIGYVIQQVGLFPHMTIERNVATVPRLLGWDKARTDRRIDELLDLVGLDPAIMRRRLPHELSGGQRQRVGFARALAADPAIMLMDEPFGAIDPITRVRLQDEFRQILKKVSKTVVIVTHDIDEAIKMGDRIAIMRDGRLLQYDTPEAILARPANDFVESFLGPDRAIKRLSLIEVASVMTRPATEVSAASISPSASLHDALALILADDLQGLDVKAESGERVGYLSREAVLSAHR